MNGPITRDIIRDPWDDIEAQLLAALQQSRSLREVATRTDLPPDTVKSQINALLGRGLLIEDVSAGVRYQLSLTGRARLSTLTRPGHQAAA